MLKFVFKNVNDTKAVTVSIGVLYYFDYIRDKRIRLHLSTNTLIQKGKYFESIESMLNVKV